MYKYKYLQDHNININKQKVNAFLTIIEEKKAQNHNYNKQPVIPWLQSVKSPKRWKFLGKPKNSISPNIFKNCKVYYYHKFTDFQ